LPLGTDNVQLRHQLHSVKRRIGDLQSELVHLRRMAQVNAQSSREILVTSFDKIRTMLASNVRIDFRLKYLGFCFVFRNKVTNYRRCIHHHRTAVSSNKVTNARR
jgi:hypothetical protein